MTKLSGVLIAKMLRHDKAGVNCQSHVARALHVEFNEDGAFWDGLWSLTFAVSLLWTSYQSQSPRSGAHFTSEVLLCQVRLEMLTQMKRAHMDACE